MSSSEAWVSIEKLNGSENYHTWAYAIQNLLDLNNYENCIKTGKQAETDEEKLRKAKARIVLSIDKSLYPHVTGCTTAYDLWTKLKQLFEDKGLVRRIGLLRKLVTTQLESCESMRDYVSQIFDTSNKLHGIGFSVADEWLASILLAGLPSDFQPMIMGLESSGATLTSDLVRSKLLDTGFNENVSSSAFFGKHKQNKRVQSNVKCFNCGKRGHISKNCYSKEESKQSGSIIDEEKKSSNKSDVAKTGFFVATTDTAFLSRDHQENWYIDSGASQHMTPYENLFVKLDPSNVSQITSASKDKISVKGAGNIAVRINETEVDFNNVLCVPGLSANLLSVGQMVKNGNELIFNKEGCKVFNHQKVCIAEVKPENGVYRFPVQQVKCMAAMTDNKNALSWHRKLGHINFSDLCKMRNGLVDGIDFKERNEIEIKNCVVCKEGKQTRQSFAKSTTRTNGILNLVHSDLNGPMENRSIGGARYILTFIDDHSRKIFVYFLREKTEVFDRFVEFKSMVERQTGQKLKAIRTDNGTEYVNSKFSVYLKKHGIQHQKSVVYTPEQNGIAERANRKLVEKAKCMLFDANLDVSYWAEAVNMAAHILNCSANSVLDTITPEEAWSGNKVNVSHLQLFGNPVMVHVPKQNRRKWDKKSKKMVFVGFSEGVKGYRCIDPMTKELKLSRDVIFLQENGVEKAVSLNGSDEVRVNESKSSLNKSIIDESDINLNNDEHIHCEYEDAHDRKFVPENEITQASDLRRSARIPKPRTFDDYVTYSAHMTQVEKEPTTVREALNCDEGEMWKSAMNEEIDSLIENGTYKLVDLPKDRKPIKSKWVFKIKRDDNDNIIRYKARLVAKGCSQVYGIDYEEVYSPVVRYSSVRFLISLAVKNGLKIDQMDAVTAFLQGDLSEEIYMEQPEGFDDNSKRVCKLNKTIYGLKQSGRVWNEKLTKMLKTYGLRKSVHDPCVFYANDLSLMLTIYVDDFLIFWKDENTLKKLKHALSTSFKMKDLGTAKSCIGLRIIQNNGVITLDQKSYIVDVIKRFGMENCKPVSSPSDMNQKLSISMCPQTEEEKAEMANIPYQAAVGCLLYIAQGSRPDIAFAVNDVSRFNTNYGKPHWTAVKRIIRYLSGTLDYKLNYTTSDVNFLTGHSDADWASDVDKRRSCTGYVFILSNGAISWSSKRQETVALSSTEAEYIALSWATREAIWLRNFGQELDKNIGQPVHIKCDNQSAIHLSHSECFNTRTKHIDVRYHHTRDQIENGIIKVCYVSSEENAADVLTKGVSGPKTKLCSKEMGLG